MIGCCNRLPSVYLDKICKILERVCELNNESYFLGDLNIDWDLPDCSLKLKLKPAADACGLSTRIRLTAYGTQSSTQVLHILIRFLLMYQSYSPKRYL